MIRNVALALPAGIKTEAGTLAADGMPLLNDTVIPPVGAAALSVTVP